jgi:anti-anti-sigma factor
VGVLIESDLCVLEALDTIVIEARGTLDVFLAQRFLDAAVHCVESNRDTRLDCASLERIDASGLQVLLALRKALTLGAHRLELVNVSPNVAAYLALAGSEQLLRAEPEEARLPSAAQPERATP